MCYFVYFRRELAGVLQEAQTAEEQRMEEEEDTWRHHEANRIDLEKHQQLLAESEAEKAHLEQELDELRNALQENIGE